MRPAALGVCSSLWSASHPLGHLPWLFSDLIFLSDAVRMNGLVQPLASTSVLTTCA